jgi:dolichol-phosphate mannosyltransferase
MSYLAVIWIVSRLPGQPPEAAVHLHERAALVYSMVAVLMGAQLVAIGFVAEMIAALVSRDRDEFSIAEYASPRESSPEMRRGRGATRSHEG